MIPVRKAYRLHIKVLLIRSNPVKKKRRVQIILLPLDAGNPELGRFEQASDPCTEDLDHGMSDHILVI